MSDQYYCATAAVASDFVLGLLSGLRRGRRSLSPGVGGGGRGGLPPKLELESESGTCGRDTAGLELEVSTIFVAGRTCRLKGQSGRGQRNLKFVGTLNFQFHRNEQESTAFSAIDWDRLHLME